MSDTVIGNGGMVLNQADLSLLSWPYGLMREREKKIK